MIRYEFGAMDLKAETLAEFGTPGLRGARSKMFPYFIMLNWTKLGTTLGDKRLLEGSPEYRSFVQQWGAVRLFHEGYHVLDERLFGSGYSFQEELAAHKAEILFYKFLRDKHGYFDPDLEAYSKMDDAQLERSLGQPNKYGGLPRTRGIHKKGEVFPLIPQVLPP